MSHETVTPSVGLRLRGLFALIHSGPSLASALAYVVFAVIAARGQPNLKTLAATAVGMVALQFAISALNDYCDREADKHSHKFKPLAQGILPAWFALAVTAILTALMIVCYAPFGITPLLIAGAYLILGFAYDLGLKTTPLGALLMGLAFPLLPLLAWDLFAHVTPALYWAFPLGLAIGASIHIADALPDLAADRASGGRTLALALGPAAPEAQWILLVGANLLIIVLAVTGVAPAQPALLGIATGAAFALIAAGLIIARQHDWPESRRLRANFILVILAALAIAVGWVISVLA
jgi:4-hydroxybenzoate polyprenyltransferase